MKVVLLAGGLGTRLREETEFRPKPMVPIGSQPILWHIMKTFAHFKHQEFIVCTGYKAEVIREYFRNFETMNLDFTIEINGNGSSSTKLLGKLAEFGWKVTVSDTGPTTPTGGRLHQIKNYVGNETFMCTYGDGVADINIDELLKFHKSHGRLATLSAVQPPSRFGVLDIENNGRVNRFQEKPKSENWVNAGYFVFEPEIFNYLDLHSTLENEPLSQIAAEGQLMAFKHEGFWQPMDTYRETTMLTEMWEQGTAPWKIWQ
jgi:glucose-1-phosphate cytidylyltransferase